MTLLCALHMLAAEGAPEPRVGYLPAWYPEATSNRPWTSHTEANVRASDKAKPTIGHAHCKRSFLRAQRRAALSGSTFYRGRLHSSKQLRSADIPIPISHRTPKPKLTLSTNPDKIRVLVWNAGGLHTEKYQELLTWENIRSCLPGCSSQNTFHRLRM